MEDMDVAEWEVQSPTEKTCNKDDGWVTQENYASQTSNDFIQQESLHTTGQPRTVDCYKTKSNLTSLPLPVMENDMELASSQVILALASQALKDVPDLLHSDDSVSNDIAKTSPRVTTDKLVKTYTGTEETKQFSQSPYSRCSTPVNCEHRSSNSSLSIDNSVPKFSYSNPIASDLGQTSQSHDGKEGKSNCFAQLDSPGAELRNFINTFPYHETSQSPSGRFPSDLFDGLDDSFDDSEEYINVQCYQDTDPNPQCSVDLNQRPESLQEAISMYIEFLIWENEQKTRISRCTLINVGYDFTKEDYFLNVICKPVPFPTDKFRKWLKLYHVDIEITDPEGHIMPATVFGQEEPHGSTVNHPVVVSPSPSVSPSLTADKMPYPGVHPILPQITSNHTVTAPARGSGGYGRGRGRGRGRGFSSRGRGMSSRPYRPRGSLLSTSSLPMLHSNCEKRPRITRYQYHPAGQMLSNNISRFPRPSSTLLPFASNPPSDFFPRQRQRMPILPKSAVPVPMALPILKPAPNPGLIPVTPVSCTRSFYNQEVPTVVTSSQQKRSGWAGYMPPTYSTSASLCPNSGVAFSSTWNPAQQTCQNYWGVPPTPCTPTDALRSRGVLYNQQQKYSFPLDQNTPTAFCPQTSESRCSQDNATEKTTPSFQEESRTNSRNSTSSEGDSTIDVIYMDKDRGTEGGAVHSSLSIQSLHDLAASGQLVIKSVMDQGCQTDIPEVDMADESHQTSCKEPNDLTEYQLQEQCPDWNESSVEHEVQGLCSSPVEETASFKTEPESPERKPRKTSSPTSLLPTEKSTSKIPSPIKDKIRSILDNTEPESTRVLRKRKIVKQ